MATGRIPINGTAAIQSTIVDAKGDLIVGTGADAVSRLAVGTNTYTLVADSAEATGLKWAAPAGGGKVLQVVSATTSTRTDVSSTTYTDSGVSASITPSSTNSKILILITHSINQFGGTGLNPTGNVRLVRGSTAIFNNIAGANGALYVGAISGGELEYIATYNYLDSPSTTSATTYKSQMKVSAASGGASITTNIRSGSESTITLLEIGA